MELKFENLYKSVVFGLWASRSHPNIPRNPRWLAENVGILLVNGIVTGWLINSIIFYDIKEYNLVNAYRNSTMVVMSFVVNFKYGMLLYFQTTFKKIISNIDNDYKNSMDWSEIEKEIVFKYTKKAFTVGKIWCLTAIATSSLFPIKSVVLMIYYYMIGESQLVPMFELHYPSFIETRKNDYPVFLTLYVVHMLFAAYSALMFMGFEPLGPIFVVHPCCILEVVRVRLLKLFEGRPEDVQANLKECILLLLHVYRFVNDINKVFTFMFEINAKFTPLMISLITFQLMESFKLGEPNLEFMSLLFGVFVYFFFPCYYSDNLQEMGFKVREAMYSCKWEGHRDLRARKTLVVMMTRAMHPPSIRSYFSTLCLDTFAQMCRQAYTIFNVMNVAWN